MRFGVHVSIAGSFAKAVARAESLGCEAFQIFAGNPRGWARKPLPPRPGASGRPWPSAGWVRSWCTSPICPIRPAWMTTL